MFKMETVKLFCLAICVVCVTADTRFDGFIDWPDYRNLNDSDVSPLTRIVGGQEAVDGQFPYQVSLRKWQNNQHYCGAALVNSRFMLTAAHCTMGKYASPSSLYAVVGWTGQGAKGEAYPLEAITPHPAFDINKFMNDIALLRTEREVKYSSHVWPIALPVKNTPSSAPVVVAGWGLNSGTPGVGLSPTLKYVELRTIDQPTCSRWYEGKNLKANIGHEVVCTTSPINFGTCMGDSGGPLADTSDPNNKILAGLVSWGVACARGYPDVFTRVHSHLYWVTSEMKRQSPKSVESIE